MATQRTAIDEVADTEPVIMEVVAGARNDRQTIDQTARYGYGGQVGKVVRHGVDDGRASAKALPGC